MKAKLFILLLSLTVIWSSCGNKKSGESVQVPQILPTAPVMDYKMMIIAKVSVKPEKVKDFTGVAKEMIEKSNNREWL